MTAPRTTDRIARDVATNGTVATTAPAETAAGSGTRALLNLGVPA